MVWVTVDAAMDTTPEVFDLLVEQWRSMSPGERAVTAGRLSADVGTLALAGIQAQHPGMSRSDLVHELARRRYGTELADAAYGERPTT